MLRRSFLEALAIAPISIPSFAQLPSKDGKLKITAVEVWRVDGRREAARGVNAQHQVNPLHVYEEYRPKPYKDSTLGSTSMRSVNALYLKIKTDAGLDGFYGPIDREVATVVDQELKSFLIGKDPLAGEAVWDQMHRSNRHSRRGLYLMAISAVDNTLWDLRGRYYNQPVYRLLGGPTRPDVEAYASCLGYSLEPEAVRTRSRQFQSEGFRYEKWFLAYGPGDGYAGLKKNVELVKNLREALGDEIEIMFDAFQRLGSKLRDRVGQAGGTLSALLGSKRPSIPRRSRKFRAASKEHLDPGSIRRTLLRALGGARIPQSGGSRIDRPGGSRMVRRYSLKLVKILH